MESAEVRFEGNINILRQLTTIKIKYESPYRVYVLNLHLYFIGLLIEVNSFCLMKYSLIKF